MQRGAGQGDPPQFDEAFRARLADLFAWRRDVRRFKPDPVESSLIEALVRTAARAPVGRQQPALALRQRRNPLRAGGGHGQFPSLQRGGAGLL